MSKACVRWSTLRLSGLFVTNCKTSTRTISIRPRLLPSSPSRVYTFRTWVKVVTLCHWCTSTALNNITGLLWVFPISQWLFITQLQRFARSRFVNHNHVNIFILSRCTLCYFIVVIKIHRTVTRRVARQWSSYAALGKCTGRHLNGVMLSTPLLLTRLWKRITSAPFKTEPFNYFSRELIFCRSHHQIGMSENVVGRKRNDSHHRISFRGKFFFFFYILSQFCHCFPKEINRREGNCACGVIMTE